MTPDARVAAQIADAGRALADALGARVACVALYGSAAGEEFSPAHSDVNLLIVLNEIEFADLRLIGATLERAAARHGLRFATPLVVSPEFLAAARDSFPIELEDLRTRHRILAGEDLVAPLRVARAAVRVAAEREARTMLLRVHALAIHRPPDAIAREALSHLAAAFVVVGAALVDCHAGSARPRGRALLAEVAARLGIALPSFGELLAMRDGERPWPAAEALDALLARLVGELGAVIRAIDGATG
ncbi:MAG TPA: hypothetical protein VFD92_06550 [Candidatus Binatia bacterium]|nr:hypothetical protein [Candidatus Binatia bacterium]